ncbi:MAG: hypothetical protein AAFW70_21155 [Cyanobacteria bacterium J06635_10]
MNTKPAMAHPGHGSELMQGIVQQNLTGTLDNFFRRKKLSREPLTPNLVIVGWGIAFLFGAGYTITLEHGKTMVLASKLVYQATAIQAVLLGLVTTIAHKKHAESGKLRGFSPERKGTRVVFTTVAFKNWFLNGYNPLVPVNPLVVPSLTATKMSFLEAKCGVDFPPALLPSSN